MRAIGVNTWVWTSPLTDADAARPARPDRRRSASTRSSCRSSSRATSTGDGVRPVLDGTGLAPYVVGAMAPGRDLVATDPRRRSPRTQDYLRACVDLAAGDRRAERVRSVLRRHRPGLADDATPSARRRTPSGASTSRPSSSTPPSAACVIGIEPLNRYETSLVNTVDQALTGLGDLLGPSARAGAGHLPPQHRGALQRRRRPRGRRRTSCTSRSAATTAAPRAATRPTGRRCWPPSTRSATPGRSTSRASPPTTPPSPRPPRSGGRSRPRRTPSPPTGSRHLRSLTAAPDREVPDERLTRDGRSASPSSATPSWARPTPTPGATSAPSIPTLPPVAPAGAGRARRRRRVKAAARRYGWAESATDWQAVLDRDDIDIVDICTSRDTCTPRWRSAALEAGKHVLVEKPLANTVAEAEAMVAAAAAAAARGRARRWSASTTAGCRRWPWPGA